MTYNDSQNGRPRRRRQRRRRLINIKRVAAMADVSVRTVRRWRSDEDFPTAVTIPGKRYLRWYQDEIAAWL